MISGHCDFPWHRHKEEEGEDLSGIPYDEERPPQLSIQFEGRLSLQLSQDTPTRSLQAPLVAWLGLNLSFIIVSTERAQAPKTKANPTVTTKSK